MEIRKFICYSKSKDTYRYELTIHNLRYSLSTCNGGAFFALVSSIGVA